MKRLCKDISDAWSALGSPGFARQKAEESSKCFRRSLYFINDLKYGQIITESDIRRIRPGYGLAPKYFDEVIGRTVKTDVKRGTAVQWSHLHD
jgi:N-acetylneuraminate synthase